MIHFLFGDNASCASEHIISCLSEDASRGIPSVLIVPEQEAVGAEHMTLKMLPPSAQLTLEVLNFSRLYNRVCRDCGGLCYSYITKPLKHLMMWKTLRTVYPLLGEYSENAQTDNAFGGTILSSISELKLSSVTSSMLEEAASELAASDPSLSARLKDIALIYATYDHTVSEQYSDSSDDLSRLCDILDEYNFFEGKNVYITSFTSFTAVEHRVIDRIFKTAKNTSVTVPLPSPEYSDIATMSIEESLRSLKKNANKWGGHEDTVFGDGTDIPAPLLHLRRHLWELAENSEKPSCEGRIVMELCDTSYDEAEAAAAHICELIRGGARYRDIALIMRDAQKYRGIIEPCLDRAEIPYFFSEKTDICSTAPIKFLLSSLRIKQYNWRKNDVISHIKTGLCDFPLRDADIFEEYINTWNINGSHFTDGDWTMNPDGFSARLTARGKHILAVANATRVSLCRPLEQLFIKLEAAEGIPQMCLALYAYMQEVELEQKISELAMRELSFGNKKSADELSSLYELILGTLADIAEATRDIPATVDDLYTILKLMFDNTDIGTIPTTMDGVTVGSASMLRAGNPKYVFVLGLCEGEFPARVEDGGIFASADRAVLAEQDIVLSSNQDMRSSDELMFVRKAFSAPSEKLYLFSSVSDINGSQKTPSLPFRRVAAMFSDLSPHRYFAYDISYLVSSAAGCATHLRNILDPAQKAAARVAVSEHLPLVENLSELPVNTDTCRISPDTVRQVIGDKIYISPSSLEKYVKCPFSYYTSYMLALRQTKYGRFGANHIGDFVHYILEHIIRFALPFDEEHTAPTREQLTAEVSRTVKEYIDLICPDPSLKTRRMAHLYSRLTRLSMLIIDNVLSEFEDSDFRPAFFELRIDGKDGAPAPLSLSLDNGAEIVLRGFIDRVDVWREGESGDVYVRIVDYKTGSKQFNISDLDYGLNTQMLLYLCALCTSPGTRFSQAVSLGEDSSPIPAGVVYLSSAIPRTPLADFDTDERDILDIAQSKLSRSGILLNDPRVIDAMSHSASKDILMGITKKDDAYQGRPLIDSEELYGLFDKIKQTLSDIGDKIYSGLADCTPLNIGGSDPCQYCEMKPICRKNNF